MRYVRQPPYEALHSFPINFLPSIYLLYLRTDLSAQPLAFHLSYMQRPLAFHRHANTEQVGGRSPPCTLSSATSQPA